MSTVIQSAGFIVFANIDGQLQFLLLHYADGHWDFPKGKVEQGESLRQAAERELFEETRLESEKQFDFITSFRYMFINRRGLEQKKEVTLFLTQVDSTSVIISHEHVGYTWLNAHDALEKLTYQNAREAFVEALNYFKKGK